MKIEITMDALGRTTETITTTSEESAVLDVAIETIIQKYLAAGNAAPTVRRDATEWSLLGILRDEGIEGVRRFVEGYKVSSPKGSRTREYV